MNFSLQPLNTSKNTRRGGWGLDGGGKKTFSIVLMNSEIFDKKFRIAYKTDLDDKLKITAFLMWRNWKKRKKTTANSNSQVAK